MLDIWYRVDTCFATMGHGKRRLTPSQVESKVEHARRVYLRTRIDNEFGGSVAAFAEHTGIARPNLVAVLRKRRRVTDAMLAAIASSIGPAVEKIYEALATEIASEVAA